MPFKKLLHKIVLVGIFVLASANANMPYPAHGSFQLAEIAAPQLPQITADSATASTSVEQGQGTSTDWTRIECSKPKSHDEADLCEQRRMAQAAEQTVLLTKIQIIVGIVGAIFILWTLFYSRRAAQGAINAADAAQKSAEISEKALVSIERAFVFLKNAYATPVYSKRESRRSIAGWDFHVVWENSGSTPTQHMTTYKNLLPIIGPLPGDFQFPDLVTKLPKTTAKTFIGPKAIKDAGALYLPVQAFEDIRNAGNGRIYMWGWAEYGDVFRPNRLSRSEFCFEIVVIGDVTIPPDDVTKPPFDFVSYDKHNGSDDECYRQAGQPIPVLLLSNQMIAHPAPNEPPPKSPGRVKP